MRRRAWLLGSTAAAGALLVGWGVAPPRSRVGTGGLMAMGEGDVALNGWIKILPDGGVVLAMPRSEMGQGVHTALAMLAAEELDVPLESMRLEQAGADAIYGNVALLVGALPWRRETEEGQGGLRLARASRWVLGKLAREVGVNVTGASSSVADAWDVVRGAAATARASLLGAASLQWRLPVEDLATAAGVVSHPSGRSAAYGELARFAAATPPGSVRLKDPKAWRLIGRPLPRLDVPAKVDGSARFGADVRLPGMRHAALRLCPMLGGSPGRLDARAALAMAGVERVVRLPAYAGSTAGFAVVADSHWQSQRAVEVVEVEWRPPPNGLVDSRRIAAELEQALEGGAARSLKERGDLAAAEKIAARIVEASYSVPWLAHATLEPMNATAVAWPGRLEVWAPTQVPQLCREAAARVSGLPLDKVDLHATLVGGGFGRRLEVDYVAQAVRVAMDMPGVPVQLLWSREEDSRHDFYRPMQVARLRAFLDAGGRPAGLHYRSAGDAVLPRWLERGMPAATGPLGLVERAASEGQFDPAYDFGALRAEHVATRSGMPVGFWRSAGHSHQAFFTESFVDELAAGTGRDPVEFRRGLLQAAPRQLAVLELAAARAGWGHIVPPAGRARGVAMHESYGAIVAQVAEVSLEAGVPRVHRVVCAIDCGIVVNPGLVAQQMESSVSFALSAALHGHVDIEAGVVRQGNFPDQPMIGMGSAPVVETWIVPSTRAPAGAGDPGVPPLAPAVANALFALTGVRSRSLPLHLQPGPRTVL